LFFIILREQWGLVLAGYLSNA